MLQSTEFSQPSFFLFSYNFSFQKGSHECTEYDGNNGIMTTRDERHERTNERPHDRDAGTVKGMYRFWSSGVGGSSDAM